MITFFTIPKAFEGHVGTIQRNAVRSWFRVAPDVQVIAIGESDPELDVECVDDVARNEFGTPLLDDAFEIAHAMARHDVLCFANTDILLPQALASAVVVASSRRPFLIVGDCRNVRIEAETDDIPLTGRKRGADAIDYFAFSKELYRNLPPFAVGRPAFDNWLIWRARAGGATVVDATSAVHAVHQDHSYAHVGSLMDVRRGPEARRNRELAGGGRARLYSRFDATHRLIGGRLLPNPLGIAHSGETLRRAWAKLGYAAGLRKA